MPWCPELEVAMFAEVVVQRRRRGLAICLEAFLITTILKKIQIQIPKHAKSDARRAPRARARSPTSGACIRGTSLVDYDFRVERSSRVIFVYFEKIITIRFRLFPVHTIVSVVFARRRSRTRGNS